MFKFNEHEQSKRGFAKLTSQVADAEENLLISGCWPRLKPTPVYRFADEIYNRTLSWDRASAEWVLRSTLTPEAAKLWPDEVGKPLVWRAKTRTELNLTILQCLAEIGSENREIHAENNRVEPDLDVTAANDFLENYREGRDFDTEVRPYLSEAEREEIWESLQKSLNARGWKVSGNNLAVAWAELLDGGGRTWTLFQKAQAEKQRRAQQAKAQSESEALEASRQIPVEYQPSENLATPQAIRDRRREDAANKALSPEQLEAKYKASLNYGPHARH
jgi:hypothetical protein